MNGCVNAAAFGLDDREPAQGEMFQASDSDAMLCRDHDDAETGFSAACGSAYRDTVLTSMALERLRQTHGVQR